MLAPLSLILVYNQYIDKKISDYFHLFWKLLNSLNFSNIFSKVLLMFKMLKDYHCGIKYDLAFLLVYNNYAF
jgi:hypothetical protein